MAPVGEQVDSSRLATIARELADSSDRGVPPGDYFLQLLRSIQEVLSPRSATVWGIDDRGVLAKIAEVSASNQRAAADSAAMRIRTNRLLDALGSAEPRVFSAGGNAADSAAGEVDFLVPFADGARPCGVIEVSLLRSSLPSAGVDRASDILVELAAFASSYVKSLRGAAEEPPGGQVAGPIDRVVLELHRDLCVSHVALTAVNEGRHLLGCDRLSLAARRGNRTEILAVSGQERIVTRSNLIRAMTDLAGELIAAEKPFRCDGDVEILPPQLREPVLEYLKESGARCIAAYPLRKLLPGNGEHNGSPRYETCGLLLSEHFQQPKSVVDSEGAQAFCDHVAVALANARQLERSSTPLRRIGRQLFGPATFRNASQAALAVAIALAVIVIVGLAPVRYRVEAPGRLMPVRRSELFAPLDGRVKEVLVDGNQMVTEGQILLRLDNERLATEILTTQHELQEQQRLLATLEAQSAEAVDKRERHESIRLSGAISQAKIEISSIGGQLQALKDESRELEVRAPISGMVTTFDPRRLLLNRPVQRGESLLEVMDTDGRWELELDLPARRVGQVLRAQTAAGAAPVPVQFTLTSEPDKVFTGALRTVSSRIVAGPGSESVAPLDVSIAVREIAHPVAGVDATARIDCGKEPLGRVVFGDMVDFFRRQLW